MKIIQKLFKNYSKTIVVLLLSLLTVVVCFTACKKNLKLTDEEQYLIKNKKMIYQEAVGGKIYKTQEGILFFHKNEGRDKYSKVLSLLVSDTNVLSDLYQMLAGDVDIKYFYNSVEFVSSSNGDKILFVVSNDSGHKKVHGLKNKAEFKKIIFGYELAYMKNKDYDLSKLNENQLYSKQSLMARAASEQIDESKKCDSGGVGATECSVGDIYSNCSVSCSNGYYACCQSDGNNCECIKISRN